MKPARGRSSTVISQARALCLFVALLSGSAAAVPESGEDVIGEVSVYATREEDTLLDIARDFDIGFVEIRAANPGVDPWLPEIGARLVIPGMHILPPAPRRGIVINLAEMRLYFFAPGHPPRTYPVGIGREAFETPVGATGVVRKAAWPAWYPTRSAREEDPDLPAYVPPGPDNPMGTHAVYLGWPTYAIHGTNKPDSIGRRGSHGCIRLYPEDAEELFHLIEPGTPVRIVDQPVKTGWRAGELWLEVHPAQADADELESHGRLSAPPPSGVEEQVMSAAGAEAGRVDWYLVAMAALDRRGVPVRVTVPAGEIPP